MATSKAPRPSLSGGLPSSCCRLHGGVGGKSAFAGRQCCDVACRRPPLGSRLPLSRCGARTASRTALPRLRAASTVPLPTPRPGPCDAFAVRRSRAFSFVNALSAVFWRRDRRRALRNSASGTADPERAVSVVARRSRAFSPSFAAVDLFNAARSRRYLPFSLSWSRNASCSRWRSRAWSSYDFHRDLLPQGLAQPVDLGGLGLRPRHRLAQPGDLPAQRHRAAPVRVDGPFPEQPGQPCHLGARSSPRGGPRSRPRPPQAAWGIGSTSVSRYAIGGDQGGTRIVLPVPEATSHGKTEQLRMAVTVPSSRGIFRSAK